MAAPIFVASALAFSILFSCMSLFFLLIFLTHVFLIITVIINRKIKVMNIIIRIYTCQKRKVKVWKDPIKEDKGDERDYGEEEGMKNRPAPYRATSPPVTVPATEAEFPLWIARLNLCFKNMRKRGSPEREAKREPICL